jgi:SAM-dependent methyltransferase
MHASQPLGLLLVAVALGGACGSPPAPEATPAAKRLGYGAYVARLEADARALAPSASSELARSFLEATHALPPIRTRTIHQEKDGKVETMLVDEEKYYDGDVSNPTHYVRALELAAGHGVSLGEGSKLLDFGYGSIGHLRLLASLGFDVTGIDVKPALLATYSEPGDTGPIAGLHGKTGRLRVLSGFFPTDPKLLADVGTGYDLFLSKNTLKKGYIHPDRPAPDKWLIHLGVDDASFLHTLHDLLKPGGRVVLYNIFVPIPPDQPFKPMSDGRSPFSREAWSAAGFTLDAFDEDDSDPIRHVLQTAHDDEDDTPLDTIRALFTIARRNP